MPNLEFNQQNISDLADTVSTLLPNLTQLERVLLLAIFAAAAARAEPSGAGGTATLPLAEIKGGVAGSVGSQPATVDALKQQLLNAYIPGNDFNSLTEATLKITGDQITAMHPPGAAK